VSWDAIFLTIFVWLIGGTATAYSNRCWEDFFVWPIFVARKVFRRAMYWIKGG